MKPLIILFLSFLLSTFGFSQITNTKLLFKPSKDKLIVGAKNYVQVVTSLEKQKITLMCPNCTLTCTDVENLIFEIRPSKNSAGKEIKLEVIYYIKGKPVSVYSQMVKIVVPRKKP